MDKAFTPKFSPGDKVWDSVHNFYARVVDKPAPPGRVAIRKISDPLFVWHVPADKLEVFYD